MSFFLKNKNGGFMDQIRCDEPSYLIWKWHPAGVQSGAGERENSIRWGSSLRVKDGEVAVFVYKQKNGIMQDFIVGPFEQIIKTANFPMLANVVGLAYEGGTPFQAEIYFINLAQIIQVKFGVPYFDVFDPRFSEYSVPVAVRGSITFKITDYRKFIKLHRLSDFRLEDFQKQIKDVVCRYVKDAVANAPAVHNIPIVQIETKTAMINEAVEYDLSKRLKEDFGISVSGVDIGAIEIDKSSSGYSKLMAVTQEITTAIVKAQAEINIKDIQDKQRIDIENVSEILRMQREETQYAQRMHTRSSNFAAYQTEKKADVGVAGANALGQMGATGAGNVNFSSSEGINMAAMMASMAVGGVVGQNIAGSMNNMMSGMNQQIQNGTVPPPIPGNLYHVVVNGQATGPFNLDVLSQMAANGQFSATSLVWKDGMPQWVQAGSIAELEKICSIVPPIPNSQ